MIVIRSIVSPVVFVFCICAMLIFPAFLGLIIGGFSLLGNVFRNPEDRMNRDELNDCLILTFLFIVFPYETTKQFILKGNFDNL